MGVPRERRLIAEWAEVRHPDALVHFNHPLGKKHEDLVEVYGELKGLNRWRPWRLKCDAIVITGTTIRICEAKIFEIKSAVGDLLVYKQLVPVTPELIPHLPRTIELVMVVPWLDPTSQELAQASNIIVDIFTPEWVRDFVEEHGKYFTRPYQQARAERKKIRQALGVE